MFKEYYKEHLYFLYVGICISIWNNLTFKSTYYVLLTLSFWLKHALSGNRCSKSWKWKPRVLEIRKSLSHPRFNIDPTSQTITENRPPVYKQVTVKTILSFKKHVNESMKCEDFGSISECFKSRVFIQV